MSSKEYHDGRTMENNLALHSLLKTLLNFDDIDSEGGGHTGTKGDAFGIVNEQRIPISVKYSGTPNTQVHLTTLEQLSELLDMPTDVYDRLQRFFGVTDTEKFWSWFVDSAPTEFELHNKRMTINHIAGWDMVIKWLNTQTEMIARLCIQSIKNENPVRYLTWINKNTNRVSILDTELLIAWIRENCVWQPGPRNGGTTFRCVYTNSVNAKGKTVYKPLLSCQMKGSGGKNGEKDHCPQFHIHNNWPDAAVLHKNLLLS